jgi:hypothetical protein
LGDCRGAQQTLLTTSLRCHRCEGNDDARLAALLAEIENLSDAEAAQLLAEEQQSR